MSALAIFILTGVSLAALGHLAAHDPKRRRVFGLRPRSGRRTGLAWTAALLPGILVPFWAGAAGFLIWFGAVAVLGWTIAATSPHRAAQMRRLAWDRLLAARRHVEPLVREAGRRLPQRRASQVAHAALELRVRQLEAEVAALKASLAEPSTAGKAVAGLPRAEEGARIQLFGGG